MLALSVRSGSPAALRWPADREMRIARTITATPMPSHGIEAAGAAVATASGVPAAPAPATEAAPADAASTAQAEPPVLTSRIGPDSSIALVRINRSPVNSMSLELIRQLHDALATLEADQVRALRRRPPRAFSDGGCRVGLRSAQTVQGVVLASALPNVFCAGLDLQELLKSPTERLRAFWTALQDLWICLYGHSKPTMAAIEGDAYAGGCLLALSCDFRIMASSNAKGKPLRMGLNETQIGIAPPFWFRDSLTNVVGVRHAEARRPRSRAMTESSQC